MASPTSPLTTDHAVQLRNSLDRIQLVKNQIDLAKRAGIDVSAQEQKLLASEETIRKVLNTYFPGM